MNKKENNKIYFHGNFFPKNCRGQFFLILVVIIISVIAGLASVVNFVEKKDDARFYYAKDELEFESGKVIDYGINQNLDADEMKSQLTTFAEDYSKYSNADDFYYIFGTTSQMTFAGLRKKSNGNVNVDFDSIGNGRSIALEQGVFKTEESIAVSSPTGTITVDGTAYSFTLNQGQNFFFVVSKEVEGDVYTIANG